MANIRRNQTGSSKKKTIIIASAALFVLAGLGAGLGVAFGIPDGGPDDWSTITDTAKPLLSGVYWETIGEGDPTDSSKRLQVLRIKKEATTEAHLEAAYKDLTEREDPALVATYTDLNIPYHFRDKVTEERVKEIFHFEHIDADHFGYIFNKTDYVVDQLNRQSSYQNTNIVEVNLPETALALIDNQFRDNKIRKVNWSELTKLRSMGSAAFFNNRLAGDLDLSGMTSFFSMGAHLFGGNYLDGKLTLPPNITSIDKHAFNSTDAPQLNKIKGTLKLPKTMKIIGDFAFSNNEIEVLDLGVGNDLETIYQGAFMNNKLKTFALNETSLPKIETIGDNAFFGNPGINGNGEMFTTSFTLPKTLDNLGTNAFKVKDGITITITLHSPDFPATSFEGNPTIKKEKSPLEEPNKG